MANEIKFKVDSVGKITPATEQKAGVQGSHNVTKVIFDVTDVTDVLEHNTRFRLQFVDGAGGFSSSGFLTPWGDGERYYVESLLTSDITAAGGLANVYFVATEIEYVDTVARENEVFISESGKLRFVSSAASSQSEYAYRMSIAGALLETEKFADNAEQSAIKAEGYLDATSGNAESAANSANVATNSQAAAELAKETANGYALEAEGHKNAAATSAASAENSANVASAAESNANMLAGVSSHYADEALKYANEVKAIKTELTEDLGEVEKIGEALAKIIELQESIIG